MDRSNEKDILRLIDYKDDQVIVSGSAYFDNYYKKYNFNKATFIKDNNFDPNKKIILFATDLQIHIHGTQMSLKLYLN